jgi:hypothetical protein
VFLVSVRTHHFGPFSDPFLPHFSRKLSDFSNNPTLNNRPPPSSGILDTFFVPRPCMDFGLV